MLPLSFSGSLVLILIAALIGALPPLLGRWNDRQLHLFVGFGAGVFLGAVFFHLIPEAIISQPDPLTNFMILSGFMLVLFVERVLVRRNNHGRDERAERRHQVVGISAFVGLSIHGILAGFALGVGFVEPKIALVIFLAIITHKTTAAFSLATVFKLSGFPTRRSLWMLAVFALSTPAGALVSLPLLNTLNTIHFAIPTSLAAGTFIYVATMDLLPEAFHDYRKPLGPFIALSIGILLMLLVTLVGG